MTGEKANLTGERSTIVPATVADHRQTPNSATRTRRERIGNATTVMGSDTSVRIVHPPHRRLQATGAQQATGAAAETTATAPMTSRERLRNNWCQAGWQGLKGHKQVRNRAAVSALY